MQAAADRWDPGLRGDTLVGIENGRGNQQPLGVALSDIREVATRGFSAGRTFWLLVGVAVAVVAAPHVISIPCPCGN